MMKCLFHIKSALFSRNCFPLSKIGILLLFFTTQLFIVESTPPSEFSQEFDNFIKELEDNNGFANARRMEFSAEQERYLNFHKLGSVLRDDKIKRRAVYQQLRTLRSDCLQYRGKTPPADHLQSVNLDASSVKGSIEDYYLEYRNI